MKIKKIKSGDQYIYPATIAAAVKDANFLKNDVIMTQGEINQELKNYKSITWEELKNLQDNSELVPGQQYRITDYVCTTTQDKTRAQDHQFDIVVTATSSSKLDENAKATHHNGDTYFSSENLNAWELKYCLDNDTAKYAWADETNGKGVIWHMKDDFDNECYYDFKNIQILRDADFNTKYGFEDYTNSMNQTVHYGLTASDYYYYTFTYIDANNTVYDLSLGNVQKTNKWDCLNNVNLGISNGSGDSNTQQIPLNVFCANSQGTGNAKSIYCNTIKGYNNTFGGRNTRNIILEALAYDNFFADTGYCYDIHLYDSCFSNIFRGTTQGLTGAILYRNTFEGDITNCNFAGITRDNTFKGSITDCTLFGYVAHNTVQQIARCYIFGHFTNNTCADAFGQCTISHMFSDNTINQKFLNNTVFADFTNNTIDCYFRDTTIESNVKYVHFNGDDTQVNNYHIYSALSGTSDALLEITPKTGATSPRGLAQKEDGTVLDWGIADNLITGVKGENDSEYQVGNVNITAESLGLGSTSEDISALKEKVNNLSWEIIAE